MSKYRKKPVVIEAEQWFPDRTLKGVHWERQSGEDGEFLVPYVTTVHDQRAYLAAGDWVIPEPTVGKFYPCKPDIFAATYEAVEASRGGGEVDPLRVDWNKVDLAEAYDLIEGVRRSAAQDPDSFIDSSLRVALEGVEAADCEWDGITS